jgi:hypothetical protein
MEAAHHTSLPPRKELPNSSKTYDETYIKDLKDPITFFISVTVQALLAHLRINCGGMELEDLVALQTAMSTYYAECEGIPEYIIMLKKAPIRLS